MMISFQGVATFKKAFGCQAAQKLPLDKILVETRMHRICYPKRGRENPLGYTRYVVDKIAELRGLTEVRGREVAGTLADNAMRIALLDE